MFRSIGTTTRPCISPGLIGHPSSDRIKLDVAVAGQDVLPRIDQARFVASLPQGSRPAMSAIEQARVVAPEGLHQS